MPLTSHPLHVARLPSVDKGVGRLAVRRGVNQTRQQQPRRFKVKPGELAGVHGEVVSGELEQPATWDHWSWRAVGSGAAVGWWVGVRWRGRGEVGMNEEEREI